MKFAEGLVYESAEGDLDVRARVVYERWAHGEKRRAILGGLGGERPFVLGLERAGNQSARFGEPGANLADVLGGYLEQPAFGPNRAARRSPDRRR